MIFGRIQRTQLKARRKVAGPSLRYELICDGAVKRYQDGREVCQQSLKGAQEYRRRTEAMDDRQEHVCCICKDQKRLMKPWDRSFEHVDKRGMGGSRRDDRIEDEQGNWMNGAAHIDCNTERGSRRE